MLRKDSERLIVAGEHLYQPPRVPAHQELATFHATPDGIDWTARINQQSYAPQVEKHVFDKASLDMYGSLRQQLTLIDPESTKKLRSALRERGVGDPFIHPLLPDLSLEDKHIVISAGRTAFKREVGTDPQWFWPPETALDTETLEVLSLVGYQGVLCAPEQIQLASGHQTDNQLVTLLLPSGREIYALPFDRPVSQELAFHPKKDADMFRDQIIIPRLDRLPAGIPLVSWTDGETFGHHSKWGDFFLTYLLFASLEQAHIDPISINEIFSAWKGQPTEHGRLNERSAWSCPHGDLVRWHGGCGCSGEKSGAWKTPFYHALHTVNNAVTDVLRQEVGDYSSQLIDQFPDLLANSGSQTGSPIKSILSAKVSSLTGLTSCGTYFDNPHTAGHINVAFCLQAVLHLRDAGLRLQADAIWQQFESDLADVPDSTLPDNNLRSLPKILMGDHSAALAFG